MPVRKNQFELPEPTQPLGQPQSANPFQTMQSQSQPQSTQFPQLSGGFQFRPEQMQLIGQQAQPVQDKIFEFANKRFSNAQQHIDQGPLAPGDETAGAHAFYARQYQKAIREGLTPDQAAERANAILQTPTQHGENRNDIMQFQQDRLLGDNWLQNHIARFTDPNDKNFAGQPGGTLPPGGTPPPTATPPAGPSPSSPMGDGPIPPSAPQGQPAPFPNQGPVTAVGQDPMSQGIDFGLGQVIGAGGGATSQIGRATENSLASLLGQGGNLNQDILNSRLESAQEELLGQERQALSSLEARMADRNLRGGAFAGGLEDLTERVQGQRARTTRDIFADESTRADQRLMGGLSLGSGLAQSGTQNLLGAVGQGTNRQNMLGQLALQNLAEQNDFAKFVAQFGLERDQVLSDVEQGRFDRLLPFLQLFFQGAGQSAQGFIGGE